MLLSPFISRLQSDVTSIAQLGDQHTREVAETLNRAMEGAVRSVLIDALTSLSHELGHGAIALDGDSVTVAKAPDQNESVLPATERNARIALRLPEDLKRAVEESAERSGISINSWIVNTLHDSISRKKTPPPTSGKTVRGRGRA